MNCKRVAPTDQDYMGEPSNIVILALMDKLIRLNVIDPISPLPG